MFDTWAMNTGHLILEDNKVYLAKKKPRKQATIGTVQHVY